MIPGNKQAGRISMKRNAVLQNVIGKKISGAALFIVIVVSLVIGILCSALILIGYHYKTEVYDTTLLRKLESNAASAMEYMLSPDQVLSFDTDSVLDLYEEQTDSVYVKRMHWGVYELGIVKSFSGRHSLRKIWLYGYAPAKEAASAIYLTDFGRPLSLSGHTLIKGDCYLPEAGVKRAYIEGQSFMGENLVEGKVNKSEKSLPELNKLITANLLQCFKLDPKILDKGQEVLEAISSDTLVQSFVDPTLVIHLKGATRLSNKVLSGNIMLVCDTTLHIDTTAKLENILVFASGIKIADGYKGSLQLFAKDSIVLGENCVFTYPTALGLFKTDLRTTSPSIIVGKGSSVTGLLLSYQDVSDLSQTLISVNEKALLTGQIYANGFLDIKGSVYGNVLCNKFLLKTPSTIYENHLLNAIIDRSKLPAAYTGSAILPVKSTKKIIKFLE